MKILIGTTSEQKRKIIENILERSDSVFEIIPCEVDSGIVEQPLDEQTTTQGSINRASNAIELNKNNSEYDLSIGLEAGLCIVNNLYHLVCIASIIDRMGSVYTGVSKKNPLPKTVSDRVKSGEQFGEVIREFEKEIVPQNSNISELISELINRTKGFSEALEISLLKLRNKEYF